MCKGGKKRFYTILGSVTGACELIPKDILIEEKVHCVHTGTSQNNEYPIRNLGR
jgi:hypothetical protein